MVSAIKRYPCSVRITKLNLDRLMQEIRNTYPPSMSLIRHKMRRELGFTVREHEVWRQSRTGPWPDHEYYLDFYEAAQQTWFMLKYGQYLRDDHQDQL